MSETLPQVFRYHLFCCFQQRPVGHPRGSCCKHGTQPLWEHLTQALQKLQRADVAMAATGCLGFCNAGPLMVVYPEGVWYRCESTEDLDEIVRTHLGEGRVVEHLAVVLK